MRFYFLVFLISFLLSLLLTLVAKNIAPKIGAIDKPNERKVHKKPIARLGGLAIFLSLFGVLFAIMPIDKHLIGIFIGSSVLLFFGLLDDTISLNAWVKLFGQILAALIIVASGIGIDFITNPFGGYLKLDVLKIPIEFGGINYHLTLWADLFTVFWIVLVINAINFLDGLDGLASGVSGIAALVIFFISISPDINQIHTGLFALILAGAAFGFLPLNFYPAKIFMGDSGSMVLGFILAVLAIFSGGKIATALLILGLPILDLFWAVLRRVLSGQSPFKPDKKHFHHELLKKGFSQRKTVLIIYFLTACFGFLAVLLKGPLYKLLAILFLLLVLISAMILIYFKKPKVQIDN